MVDSAFDVAAVGNAIVDVMVHVDEKLLAALGLKKGVMTLIDAETADRLYDRLPPAIECSGGSAANTTSGVASLGGKAAFIGLVKDDQLGAVFRHDLASQGVAFPTRPAQAGAPTARCLVLVTPDAQRTMQTYLGACVELGPEDIDDDVIDQARITYLEGYLWDPPAAKLALRHAAIRARAAGRKVALSLSDPFCVERHRDEFLDLIARHVDILFANQAEITTLYRTSLDDAVRRLKSSVGIAAVTRGAQGSLAIKGEQVVSVTAAPPNQLVDTTGAGDLYAAGFLYGYSQGRDLGTCARLGGICAAEIIGHIGARPAVDLALLAANTLSNTV